MVPGTAGGAAAETLEADDAMVIAGGIHAGKAGGQEGELRATAVVLEMDCLVEKNGGPQK